MTVRRTFRQQLLFHDQEQEMLEAVARYYDMTMAECMRMILYRTARDIGVLPDSALVTAPWLSRRGDDCMI